MADNLTIVDVFEEVLEVPFEARYIHDLDIPILRKLAFSLQSFLENFKIPAKADGELRPLLSSRYTPTQVLNKVFYTNIDPRGLKDLSPQIKVYLLYCHGVCFDDGLIYLLDYFRLGTDDSSELRARVPMVEHLLKQYAGIAPLLRQGIVIPVSESDVRGVGSSAAIVDELEEREIRAQLQKRIEFNNEEDLDASTHLGSIVKEDWRLSKRTGNAIDLYFPHEIYVPIFQGLLTEMQHRFTSQMVLEPFDVGILGSVSNIDPSKLRIEDIVSIRQEGAFEEFRVFLRRAFERLHTAHNFSDFETEFAAACRQELKENAEAIRAKTQKSSVLREIFTNYDKILIGAAAGAVPVAILGSPMEQIIAAALGERGLLHAT